MAVCWGAYVAKVFGRGRYLWLLPFLVLAVFLVQTISRGSALGLAAGILVSMIAVRWLPTRREVLTLILVGAAIVGYAIYHGSGSRFIQQFVKEDDRSVSNRWLIYKSVPAMFADAPGGWRGVKPQNVFQDFYQPIGRNERYSSLVNSHATWMVAWPWWGRIAYVSAWLLTCLLVWPRSRLAPRWYVVGLVPLVTFGAAACFSSVADRWELWVVPGVAVFVALCHRLFKRNWPSPIGVILVLLSSPALVFGFTSMGKLTKREPPIRHSGLITQLGKPDASQQIALLRSGGEEVLGQNFGQILRNAVIADADLGIRVVNSPESPTLTQRVGRLVLPGDAVNLITPFPAETPVILLNPTAPADQLEQALEPLEAVRVLWGDLHQSPGRGQWDALCASLPNLYSDTIPGESTYLTSWLDEALEPIEIPPSAPARVNGGSSPDPTPLPEPQTYTFVEIEVMLDTQNSPDKYLIIDARSELFFQIGHIPRAINIPAEGAEGTIAKEHKGVIRQALTNGRLIVIYCQNRHCPDGKKLAEAMWTEFQRTVAIYEAGWEQWQGSGLPVESAF